MINHDKTPRRLLCIVGGMNAGGAETFLMKLYRTIDRSKIQFDFYVAIQGEGYYDKEIISMGGKIFHSTPKTKNPLKSFIGLKNIVERENYDYVIRVSQHSLSSLDLLAAKLGGAKKLIYRSSNSNTGGGNVIQLLHILFKWLSITVPNVKIAPSTEAAIFMFGKRNVRDGKVIFLRNAIPVNNYNFRLEKRKRIRDEFQIDNKFVIGHVGRFSPQKNHQFLLSIFNEIVKVKKDSILLLVGEGDLKDEIKYRVNELGLSDNVIFTGIRNDIPDLMMGMDVFIFPSLFEGMPNTVIEAQATGLPCIISDNITKEVKLTPLVEFKSLNDNIKSWAYSALKYKDMKNRKSMKEKLIESGYDIDLVACEFEKILDN